MTTTYGWKYEATKDLDVADIAALIRADIREAQAAGRLGVLPDGVKFGVRIERYSMGQGINVTVRNAPEAWAWAPADEDTLADYGPGVTRVVSPACRDLGAVLRAILDGYNYDGSDSQSDYYHVRFSGTVCLSPGTLL